MIEQKIQELIEALNANTAALKGAPLPTKPLQPAKIEIAKEEIREAPKTVTTAEKSVTVPLIAGPTIEQIRAVTIEIQDLRAAKSLIPPNEPIKALNTHYGYKKIVDCIGTPQAAEVYEKLKALLAELKK